MVQESPISVIQERSLSLGIFIPAGSPGWVDVNPETDATTYNNVYIVSEGQRAHWITSGIGGASYALAVDPTTTLTNGSDTMEVSMIYQAGYDGILSSQGTDSFYVGATVEVGAHQPSGTYTGTYSVTVAYN